MSKNKCLDFDFCESCSKKILLWTIAGNVFLTVIKLSGGIVSGSSGLMADGMQSVSCVVASILIMYSMVIAKKQKNERYPFGYGKIEFIVALVVFSVLMGLGLYIFLSNLIMIMKRTVVPPSIIGLPVAVISSFLTYMMYKYNACAGSKLDSAGLVANGLQARADMFSSVAVTIGIIMSQLGPVCAAFDRVAAMLVGILIVYDSYQHWVVNLNIILDKGPEHSYEEKVKNIISEIIPGFRPAVIKIKRMGKKFWLGISLKMTENENVENFNLKADDTAKKLQEQCLWINEIDFFLE
ncbi:MAG: cation diffusion facilitator family transporter [Candidatus Omnitrophica bacterium]|nr:cation diffusion facilitator family transporter [Candidatus Omnitrophota bacterium]